MRFDLSSKNFNHLSLLLTKSSRNGWLQIYPTTFLLFFIILFNMAYSYACSAHARGVYDTPLALALAISWVMAAKYIGRKCRLVGALLEVGIVGFNFLLIAYFISQGFTPGFTFVYANMNAIYGIGFETILQQFFTPLVLLIVALLLGVIYFEYRFKLFLAPGLPTLSIKNFLPALFLNAYILYTLSYTSLPMSNFLVSIHEHMRLNLSKVDPLNVEPIWGKNSLSGKFKGSNPDIFILMVESYNSSLNNSYHSGQRVAPYFHKLKGECAYFPNFYSNGNHTAKGQFSLLSGIYPSIGFPIFRRFEKPKLKSLPMLLRDSRNYHSVFLCAYKDLTFDNTGSAMEGLLGVDEAISIGALHGSDIDPVDTWNWGMRDSVFYERVFDWLDKNSTDESMLITLATVNNHFPFTVPESLRKFPGSGQKLDRLNSLHIADGDLEKFIQLLDNHERFKDALVIITGDHSAPAGDHGYWTTADGGYNDVFRVPMLIRYNGVVSPVVNSRIGSHVDIAPTILDILNLEEENHFVGNSLFSENPTANTLLIQPYGGRYLSAIDQDNFKYLCHYSTGSKFLFNLTEDPGEKVNLISQGRYLSRILSLEKSLDALYLNEFLLTSDKVLPATKDD